MLLEELESKYGVNEPIFFDEIRKIANKYTRERVYQLINDAIKNKALVRFDFGVYYIPTQTSLGISLLNPRKVIEKKYIKKDNDVFGYYTGLSLLNAFGLTKQIPNIIEIYTNNEATNSRKVCINNQTIIVKKSRTKITSLNYKQLMILEIFNIVDLSMFDEKSIEKVINYMKYNKITPQSIFQFASVVPARAIKNFIKSAILNVFAF